MCVSLQPCQSTLCKFSAFLHFVKVDMNGQKWSNIWVSFPTQELQHKICLVVRFVKHTDTGED